MRCYWKKPECTWEHCQEITAHNIAKGDEDSQVIIDNQKCGGYRGERFLREFAGKLTQDDCSSIGSFILAFIEKGGAVINDMAHAAHERFTRKRH